MANAWVAKLVVAVGLCLVAGCGPPPPKAPTGDTAMPDIPAAGASWQRLAVYVEPSLVATAYRAPVLQALQEAGVRAVDSSEGGQVVTLQLNAGAPYDMNVSAGSSPEVEITQRLDASVFYDGAMVEQLAATRTLRADPMRMMTENARSQAWLARKIVQELLTSPKVAAIADGLDTGAIASSAATSASGSATTAGLVAGTPQAAAYVFVVGIERYRDLPSPTGARADAEAFAAVVRTTFGVTDDRIRVALDDRASAADIRRGLTWLARSTPAGGRAYFYFSGHGAPDPSTGASYLVPYDGDPLALDETTLPLGDVMAQLGAGGAGETLVVLDSCFSGAGGRSVLPKGTRPLVRVRQAAVPGKVALLSASTGAEISGATAGGDRGLFTTHVVDGVGRGKADLDGDAQITLAELLAWLEPRVARDAKAAGREQHPQLSVGGGAEAERFVVTGGVVR